MVETIPKPYFSGSNGGDSHDVRASNPLPSTDVDVPGLASNLGACACCRCGRSVWRQDGTEQPLHEGDRRLSRLEISAPDTSRYTLN